MRRAGRTVCQHRKTSDGRCTDRGCANWMHKPLRYNRICESCGKSCREDNALCVKCYYTLPEHIRYSLWSDDPEVEAQVRLVAVDWLLKNKES